MEGLLGVISYRVCDGVRYGNWVESYEGQRNLEFFGPTLIARMKLIEQVFAHYVIDYYIGVNIDTSEIVIIDKGEVRYLSDIYENAMLKMPEVEIEIPKLVYSYPEEEEVDDRKIKPENYQSKMKNFGKGFKPKNYWNRIRSRCKK